MQLLKSLCIVILATFILSFPQIHAAEESEVPKTLNFNEAASLKVWQEKIFKNKVLYVIESEKGEDGYLSAKSDGGCSGLFYEITFNIKESPMMSWEWKVTKFPEKAEGKGEKGGWIEKDDYAARVYVIFPSWAFPSTKSIEYIWDETLPEGTVMTSPYFKNIKIIVAQSGTDNLGKWVLEERNIYEDYKKAFGKSRAARAGAVALMTDTDNTLSTAEALYKNIKVGYKND